jgi:hypothetical protein
VARAACDWGPWTTRWSGLSLIAAFARALYAQVPVAESEAARREALAAVDALALQLDGAARPKADAPADRGHVEGARQPLAG